MDFGLGDVLQGDSDQEYLASFEEDEVHKAAGKALSSKEHERRSDKSLGVASAGILGGSAIRAWAPRRERLETVIGRRSNKFLRQRGMISRGGEFKRNVKIAATKAPVRTVGNLASVVGTGALINAAYHHGKANDVRFNSRPQGVSKAAGVDVVKALRPRTEGEHRRAASDYGGAAAAGITGGAALRMYTPAKERDAIKMVRDTVKAGRQMKVLSPLDAAKFKTKLAFKAAPMTTAGRLATAGGVAAVAPAIIHANTADKLGRERAKAQRAARAAARAAKAEGVSKAARSRDPEVKRERRSALAQGALVAGGGGALAGGIGHYAGGTVPQARRNIAGYKAKLDEDLGRRRAASPGANIPKPTTADVPVGRLWNNFKPTRGQVIATAGGLGALAAGEGIRRHRQGSGRRYGGPLR